MNKKLNKFVSIILMISLFFCTSINCREVRANAAVLTTEGLGAFFTLIGLAGVDMSSGIEIPDIKFDESDISEALFGYVNESDFVYDYSYESFNGNTIYVVENGYMNDLYVYDDLNNRFVKLDSMGRNFVMSPEVNKMLTASLSSEQIDYLNNVGAASDGGTFDFYFDGLDVMSDWFTDTFSSDSGNVIYGSINDSGVLGGSATISDIYALVSLYICDCNKSDFYDNFSSFVTNHYGSKYTYYHVVTGAFRSNGKEGIFIGFNNSPDTGIYQSGNFFFSKLSLNGLGYYFSTCSDCGGRTLSSSHDVLGAFQFLSSSSCTVLNSGVFTGTLGDVTESEQKKIFNVGDTSFGVADGSLADVLSESAGADITYDDILDLLFGLSNVGVDAGAISGVSTTGVSVDETDEGLKVLVPTSNVTIIPKDDVAVPDVPTDLDGVAGDMAAPTDIWGALQNIWNWITNFFTSLWNLLVSFGVWLADVFIGSGTLDFSGFRVNSTALASVFPFCIPFDIYNIFTLLVAEPEAPVFAIDLSDTVLGELNNGNYVITIDVSAYGLSEAVKIFRFFELLGFIIGLAAITRNIIRG